MTNGSAFSLSRRPKNEARGGLGFLALAAAICRGHPIRVAEAMQRCALWTFWPRALLQRAKNDV